jgi:hypothetical protein
MSRNAKPWTKAERSRADRMAALIGCVICWLEEGGPGPCENRHHIKSGNKRMGHWFTIPVCKRHHGNCHDGTFNHDRQIHFWIIVQQRLELSEELPASKIFPRRQVA